jgi:hypothetical protein
LISDVGVEAFSEESFSMVFQSVRFRFNYLFLLVFLPLLMP